MYMIRGKRRGYHGRDKEKISCRRKTKRFPFQRTVDVGAHSTRSHGVGQCLTVIARRRDIFHALRREHERRRSSSRNSEYMENKAYQRIQFPSHIYPFCDSIGLSIDWD